jgi:hypothetical protein
MNSVLLHKDDLVTIKQFLDAFPDKDYVEITADNSSGIGTIIKAHITGAIVNGHIVNISKDIVDESSW